MKYTRQLTNFCVLVFALFTFKYYAENGTSYLQGSSCSHQFHKRCLLGWLVENNSCPCCRQKLILTRTTLISKGATAPKPKRTVQCKKGNPFKRLKKFWFSGMNTSIIEDEDDDEAIDNALQTLALARLWLNNEPF